MKTRLIVGGIGFILISLYEYWYDMKKQDEFHKKVMESMHETMEL